MRQEIEKATKTVKIRWREEWKWYWKKVRDIIENTTKILKEIEMERETKIGASKKSEVMTEKKYHQITITHNDNIYRRIYSNFNFEQYY